MNLLKMTLPASSSLFDPANVFLFIRGNKRIRMQVKPTLWKFLIPWITGLSIVACAIVLSSPRDNSFVPGLVSGCGIGILAGTAAGYIHFLNRTKWQPARAEAFFRKKLFTDLIQSGFQRKGMGLEKTVNGYITRVQRHFNHSQSFGGSITIQVFFDPVIPEGTIDLNHLNEMRQRYFSGKMFAQEVGWNLTSVICEISTAYGQIPSSQKLLGQIDRMTGILMEERLQPLKTLDNIDIVTRPKAIL
ncbi:MAG: hypothetical protein EOO09_06020 [Chitinophagaceae bacterium]|nr:MAG: hypothetical protein EOO09_06020 [Chitinophagaceae bacterium]